MCSSDLISMIYSSITAENRLKLKPLNGYTVRDTSGRARTIDVANHLKNQLGKNRINVHFIISLISFIIEKMIKNGMLAKFKPTICLFKAFFEAKSYGNSLCFVENMSRLTNYPFDPGIGKETLGTNCVEKSPACVFQDTYNLIGT